MGRIKKVVVLGPESTGKSTLCKTLAAHFSTLWCPEFAREYLLKNGTAYRFETLETIARGQLVLEDRYADLVAGSSPAIYPPLLILDTDMYVMKVWCEYVFGKCHPLILEEIVQRKYDLYLLCNIDLPWVKDELREYPDETSRQELLGIYRDLLVNQSTPWIEIRGNYAERERLAIAAVEQLL